jgi:hypothetical protein
VSLHFSNELKAAEAISTCIANHPSLDVRLHFTMVLVPWTAGGLVKVFDNIAAEDPIIDQWIYSPNFSFLGS